MSATEGDRGDANSTLPYAQGGRGGPDPTRVRRFRLTLMDGESAGRVWESSADRCAVGSLPDNDFVVEDTTVSRYHCELQVERGTVRIRDLDSLNGVIVDGVTVKDAFLRSGSLIRLGGQVLRFDFSADNVALPLAESSRFGPLVGGSVPMRRCFALMERAAATQATVLIEGETGTGKSQVAHAIHQASARKDRPFVVIDCTAIPANLLEAELFGHEKGAFTGAVSRRVGAFEDAQGGTVFLDEIGELPPELQPKLLRVLESREVRRVGSNAYLPVDVRLIAATNRELRAQVNAGAFRSDLFFRLAVVRITLPPLRQRPEDLGLLSEQLLTSLGTTEEQRMSLLAPDFIAKLQRGAWPGNVRELRNYLERCLVFEDALPLMDDDESVNIAPELGGAAEAFPADFEAPIAEARRQVTDDFERRYLKALLARHQGKIPQAAAAAGVDRVHLYRLLRRHKIK